MPGSLSLGDRGGGPTGIRELRETHYFDDGGPRSIPENADIDADKVAAYGKG